MEAAPHPWPALGVLLLRDGFVTKEHLEAILDEQHDTLQRGVSGRRLGEILVERGVVTETQVARLVAEQYELPFLDLDTSDIDLRVATLLSEELARRFSAVPISSRPDGSVLLAVADPGSVVFSDELRRVLGSTAHFAVVGPDAIEAALAFVHDRPAEPIVVPDPTKATDPDSVAVELRPEGSPPSIASDDEPFFGSQRAVAQLWPPLGSLLIREGLVTDAELEAALGQQRLSTSRRLGEILVDRGAVTRSAIARLVAEQYELPFVELTASEVEPAVAVRLSQELARQFAAVPIAVHADGSLEVAIADPTNLFHSDELHRALGVPLTLVVAAPDAIDAVLSSVHAPPPPTMTVDLEERDVTVEPISDPETREADALQYEHVRATDHDAPMFSSTDDIVEAPAWTQETTIDVADDEGEIVEEETPDRFEDDLAAVLLAETSIADDVTELFLSDDRAEPTSPVALLDDVDPDESSGPLVVETVPEPHLRALEPETPSKDLETAIDHALALGASSIHFSPQADEVAVRARIDGFVRELGSASKADQSTLVATLESRYSGRMHLAPTVHGDKVTFFTGERSASPTSLDELGLAPDSAEALRHALARPSGAIVACGPVGSGTTTMLYAALDVLNTPDRVAVTIEDPVERLLHGVDQVAVDQTGGLTFPQGLRTILNTDSDVLLVGEIRDRETAEIAFRAAASGRHVLSALHARSAATAIRRLTDMELEPTVVATALNGLVAQRLVRRVCVDCRETHYASEADLAELGQPSDATRPRLLARGRGCQACDGTGFRGRVGIFEVLVLSDDIRELVSDGASAKKIQRAAVAAGMRTLREDAIRVCLEGVTTLSEVQRVLGVDS